MELPFEAVKMLNTIIIPIKDAVIEMRVNIRSMALDGST